MLSQATVSNKLDVAATKTEEVKSTQEEVNLAALKALADIKNIHFSKAPRDESDFFTLSQPWSFPLLQLHLGHTCITLLELKLRQKMGLEFYSLKKDVSTGNFVAKKHAFKNQKETNRSAAISLSELSESGYSYVILYKEGDKSKVEFRVAMGKHATIALGAEEIIAAGNLKIEDGALKVDDQTGGYHQTEASLVEAAHASLISIMEELGLYKSDGTGLIKDKKDIGFISNKKPSASLQPPAELSISISSPSSTPLSSPLSTYSSLSSPTSTTSSCSMLSSPDSATSSIGFFSSPDSETRSMVSSTSASPVASISFDKKTS